jgi:hypothetical protein
MIFAPTVKLDPGAHLLQPFDVQVDRPGPDGAAAGKRDSGLAAARQQRTQNENAGAHLSHQIVRRHGVDDRAGAKRHRLAAARSSAPSVAADLHPHRRQQIRHGRDVGQIRHIRQRQYAIGQNAGRHDRQGGVFGAADRDGARERLAAPYENFVQRIILWRRKLPDSLRCGLRPGNGVLDPAP